MTTSVSVVMVSPFMNGTSATIGSIRGVRHSGLPLVDDASRTQQLDYPRRARIDAEHRRVERQIGAGRLFEFTGDAWETRQLTALRGGVHAFLVAALQHRQRCVQIHL